MYQLSLAWFSCAFVLSCLLFEGIYCGISEDDVEDVILINTTICFVSLVNIAVELAYRARIKRRIETLPKYEEVPVYENVEKGAVEEVKL